MEPIEIDDRGRGPELKRIRITVYDIIPYLERGWHPSYIPTMLPITTAEVMYSVFLNSEWKEFWEPLSLPHVTFADLGLHASDLP